MSKDWGKAKGLTPEEAMEKLKSSTALRKISELIEDAERFRKQSDEKEVTDYKNFLLVIAESYRELYVKSGQMGYNVIPREHIYDLVADIDEFLTQHD